ncbi:MULTISPECIES: aminotransferase class I/II-fold pyridoxal phosphate-dependent enzyme [unclassified Streptomyces]|uniref:aminotransferase class I/II-fold pyridoxal phosphate-dependent enzyme n=1 Tax=unclassified Streptomyces TaxID=2593676 RepID=UPI0033339F3E
MPDWLWAMWEAARRMPVAELDYGDPRGSAVLREVVAGYARRIRAAAADPEHIVICSGDARGLSLTLAAPARSEVRRVAYEGPGSPVSVRAAAAADLTAVPVPVDEHGMDVNELTATGARAVVVAPAHQWPTGVVARARAAAGADRVGGRARRGGHRGRLRRGVPLRPGAGRPCALATQKMPGQGRKEPCSASSERGSLSSGQ